MSDEREMGVLSGKLDLLIDMVNNLNMKLEDKYVRKDLYEALEQRVTDLEEKPDKNQYKLANWLSTFAFIGSAIADIYVLFKK